MGRRFAVFAIASLTTVTLASAPAGAEGPPAADDMTFVGMMVAPGSSRCVAVPGASAGDVAVVNVTNTEVLGRGWGALRSSDDVAVFDRPADERFSSVNFAAGTPPNPNLGVAVVGADGEFCYDNALSSSNVVLDLFAVIPAANVASIDAARLLDTRVGSSPVAPGSSRCVAVPGASAGDVAVVNVTNTDALGRGWGALRSSDDVAVFDRPADERFSSVNFAAGTPPNPNLGVAVVGADGEFCYDNALSSSNVVLDLFAVIPAANVASIDAARLLDTRTEIDPAQFPWNPAAGYSDPSGAAAAFMQWASDSSSVDLQAFTLRPPVISSGGSSATVRVVFDELTFDLSVNRLVQPVTTIEMVRQNGSWFVSGARSPSIEVERPVGLALVPIRVAFSNTLIAGGLGFSLFADGVEDPFVGARFGGGGIFAAGEFRVAIDPVSCVSLTFAFELETCTGPPPPDVWGTLVVTSSWAVQTTR